MRVEWERRGRGTNFGSHITDCCHASTRKRLDTGSLVLDNGTSSTLYHKNSSDLQDYIYNTRLQSYNSQTKGRLYSPFGVVQPPVFPVRLIPITSGHFSSQGMSAMTSTASAPPTPQATIPRPPALGV